MNTNKFQTLSQKAKKKKDFIIVILILSIFSFLAISIGLAFMNDESKEVFKERTDIEKDKEFSIVKKQDFKENWAIAMENRIEKQAEDMKNFQLEVKEDNKKTIEEIKTLILESNASQNKKIEELGTQVNNQLSDLKGNVELRFSEQQNQIEDLSLSSNTPSEFNDINEDDKIVLGQDLLPPLADESKVGTVKETFSVDDAVNQLPVIEKTQEGDSIKTEETNKSTEKDFNSNKISLQLVEIDTTANKEEIQKENALLSELENLRLNKENSFHLMTGLSQAYMLTGAYAPAFDSGQEEPLPVLLQAEGDILIANDDTQTIDKCLLIGSAKGNMNSQTADIRLVKISCSLGEGTKKIEGSISGWVIGENGIPGVQGELLHKNGAWLSKTFVSGFLQTFSSALGSTDTTEITIGGTSNNNSVPIGTSVSNNAKSAAAGGLSTVFGKLGDYYLKMAEQIFPVIEVKGGRTVNILLKGGESFTVTDFNKLDLSSINDTIEEEKYFEEKVGTTEYLKMKKNLESKESSNEEVQKQDSIPTTNILEGRN